MLKVVDRIVKVIEAAFRGAVFVLQVGLVLTLVAIACFTGWVTLNIYQSNRAEAARLAACHFVPEIDVKIGSRTLVLKADSRLHVRLKDGRQIVGETIEKGGKPDQAFCMGEDDPIVLSAYSFWHSTPKTYNDLLYRNGLDAVKWAFFEIGGLRTDARFLHPLNVPFEATSEMRMKVVDVRGDLLVQKVLQTTGVTADGFELAAVCSKFRETVKWACRLHVQDYALDLYYELANVWVEGEPNFVIDKDRVYEASSRAAVTVRAIVSDMILPDS